MIRNYWSMKKVSPLLFAFLILAASCQNNYSPKPRGYFRIDLPEREYQVFDTNYPFTFEYPVYAEIQTKGPNLSNPYWFNLHYPNFDGTIYFSYKQVKGNLATLINDSHEFVGKHLSKASAVDERLVMDREAEKFGLIFEIDGAETASPYQFFLTDSVNHFVRGALYFNNRPNNDSLRPVISFVEEDIEHFIRTFNWKEQ
jgi:gliding motility-associated lipoprotein GldD